MIGKKISRAYVVASIVVIALQAPARAETIDVPGDQPSIQAGIDAGNPGDEVVVAEGTYFENINFNGKAIAVRSTDPTDPDVVAGTIIDAGGSGSVVTCISGEGPDTVLEGFTITGGTGTNDGFCDLGGGMYNIGSSPTVTHCTFTSNFAEFGGGMYNDFSSPTVTNCTFTSNYGFSGGGMANWSNCSPTVTNRTFTANYVDGYGGGMVGGNLVTNCTFSGNAALYQGGGMYSGGTVTNCTFSGNAASNGGGMTIVNSSPTVTNCTFSENLATNGRALALEDSWPWPPSDLTLTNSILWDGGDEIWNNDMATITITYTDVQGGFAGTGNINADPLFIDPDNGNLRLQPGSPCIDAANNGTVPEDITIDLDGNPRFVDDPIMDDTGLGDCLIVDMGAYEYQDGSTECCGDCPTDTNGDGHTGPIDLATLLGAWGPVEDANCLDADGDGVMGPIDLATLLGAWGPCEL